MRDMWSDYAHWIRCSIDMLLTLPLALFFVALAVIRLDTEKRPRLLKFIAIAAAASPLTLHVVAWDFPRFNAATQLSAFLVFLSTARLRGMPPMGDGLQRVFQ
jgi:hypothetical protein